jgi:hypothetical protein
VVSKKKKRRPLSRSRLVSEAAASLPVERQSGHPDKQRQHGFKHTAINVRAASHRPAVERTDVAPLGEAHEPYEQGLLDRVRDQWRRGDWQELQALSPAEIQHHPERARLALLSAAGHLAAGRSSSARLLAKMASDWGCDRQLMVRVLVGGVHNTLGRAWVAGGRSRERALKHFELAIASGGPGVASARLVQTRIEHELGEMGLTPDTLHLRSTPEPLGKAPQLPSPFTAISDQVRTQGQSLASMLEAQRDELANVRKSLESTVKREVLNATKQLEAYVNLQGYLSKAAVVPEVHGWPVSPDLALLLIQMLEATDYDLVIEFGSGSSTLVMAAALARTAARREGRPRAMQIAFEHLERYYTETARILSAAGYLEAVELLLAPLTAYAAPTGSAFQYYSCRDALSAVAETIGPPSKLKIFVLVDGPPAATGPMARYPAIGHILDRFSGAEIDLILDDYNREDERQVVAQWKADLAALGIKFTLQEKRLEKGACLLALRQQLADNSIGSSLPRAPQQT